MYSAFRLLPSRALDLGRASLLGLLLLCGAAQAQKKIVIGYTAVPDFAAAFIAKERGFFAAKNLNVELQLISLTSSVPPAVMSDSIQIGGTTPPVFLQAVDSGLDLVALANGSISDNTKGYINVVARNGSGIASVQDLVGKKIGVPGLGGTLHVLVRRWLQQRGIDPKRATFIEVPLPQMADVLKGGSIDAAVAPEPFITRMVQGQPAVVVQGFAADTPSGFSNVLYTTTRKWATANGEQISAVREALVEAVAFANANREDALADVGKYVKVPAPLLKAIPWPSLMVELSDARLRFWTDTMRNQDMLKKPPMVSSLLVK